jgi:hypothetical protein
MVQLHEALTWLGSVKLLTYFGFTKLRSKKSVKRNFNVCVCVCVCVFRIVEHLRRFPEVFILEQAGGTTSDGLDKETLTLHKALQSHNHRTKVVEGVLQVLREEGILPNQRNEVIYLPYKTHLLIHYTALL